MAKKDPVRKIKTSNAIYPIIIGLAAVGYLFYRDFKPEVFSELSFTWATLFWLAAAFVFMAGRDLGYIIRLRVLSDKDLGWRQAFRIIMLWEFTSAITPSAVGGTSVAIVYVHKEGINLGRSSAIVLLTSFFDELYFILMFPLLLLLVGSNGLFDINMTEHAVTTGLISIALTGYFIKLAYLLVLSYGIFINPKGLKWLLLKIFRLPFLRKWYRRANKVGNDIITSSAEFKSLSWRFWGKACLWTFLSWSSRYLVANALILAFFGMGDQLMLFARQLVMWIMMLVMPTPGGSGFAEYIFTVFCGDLIPVPPDLRRAAAALIAAFWRIVTYYPYLVIGAVVFPKWLKKNFSGQAFPRTKKRKKHEKAGKV